MRKSPGTEIDFDRPRSAPIVAPAIRIHACAVCQARTDVLICRECAEDAHASFVLVLTWLDGISDQQQAAAENWDRLRSAHLDKWEQTEAARESPFYEERCAKARAAGNIYGQLLDGFERYAQTMARLGDERERLEKALGLLEGL